MKLITALIVPVLLVSTHALAGEPPGVVAAPGPNAPLEQRLDELRGKVLREKVGLSEERARKVETILGKYAPERRRLARAMRDARKGLETLVAAGSQDQAAYRKVLTDLRQSRRALHDLTERAFGDVEKELSPIEQGRLFLALETHLRGKTAGSADPENGQGRGRGD